MVRSVDQGTVSPKILGSIPAFNCRLRAKIVIKIKKKFYYELVVLKQKKIFLLN